MKKSLLFNPPPTKKTEARSLTSSFTSASQAASQVPNKLPFSSPPPFPPLLHSILSISHVVKQTLYYCNASWLLSVPKIFWIPALKKLSLSKPEGMHWNINYMSGFCLLISGSETRHIPLILLQPWQARFLWGVLNYLWFNVLETIMLESSRTVFVWIVQYSTYIHTIQTQYT